MNKIIITCILSLLLSIILYYIPNKSNFSKYIMIPLIVILLIKYTMGDWDKGYIYTHKDILYYPILGLISIITIYILTKFFSNIH
jgi:hypothetical protein